MSCTRFARKDHIRNLPPGHSAEDRAIWQLLHLNPYVLSEQINKGSTRIGSLHDGTIQGSNARIGTFVRIIHRGLPEGPRDGDMRTTSAR